MAVARGHVELFRVKLGTVHHGPFLIRRKALVPGPKVRLSRWQSERTYVLGITTCPMQVIKVVSTAPLVLRRIPVRDR